MDNKGNCCNQWIKFIACLLVAGSMFSGKLLADDSNRSIITGDFQIKTGNKSTDDGINRELDQRANEEFFGLDDLQRIQTEDRDQQASQGEIPIEFPTTPLPDLNDGSSLIDDLTELEDLGHATISGSKTPYQESSERRQNEINKKSKRDWTTVLIVGTGFGILVLIGRLGKLVSASGTSKRMASRRSLPDKLNFLETDPAHDNETD